MQGRAFRSRQRGMEGLVARFVERAVEVIRRASPVARRREHPVPVDAVRRDDGRGGVVKRERAPPRQAGDVLRQRALGERPGGRQHQRVRLGFAHGLRLARAQRDIGVSLHKRRHAGGKGLAVHSQRAARRHAAALGHGQQCAAQQFHFRLQQAGGGIQPVGLEGIGAHKLREIRVFMRGGKFMRLLLPQFHGVAAAREIQRGLASREARAQDPDVHALTPFFRHPARGSNRSPLFRTAGYRSFRPF